MTQMTSKQKYLPAWYENSNLVLTRSYTEDIANICNLLTVTIGTQSDMHCVFLTYCHIHLFPILCHWSSAIDAIKLGGDELAHTSLIPPTSACTNLLCHWWLRTDCAGRKSWEDVTAREKEYEHEEKLSLRGNIKEKIKKEKSKNESCMRTLYFCFFFQHKLIRSVHFQSQTLSKTNT